MHDKDKKGKLILSKKSPEKLEETIDEALSLRDHILSSTILRDCDCVSEDRAKEYNVKEIRLDREENSAYLFFGNLNEHFGRNVFLKGFWQKLIVRSRIRFPKHPVFGGMNETDMAECLYDYACVMSKAYALAKISSQIRDFKKRCGKNNYDICGRIRNGHYYIVLKYFETGDSIVPTDSEETIIPLPDAIYKELGEENVGIDILNLSYYDDSCYDLLERLEEYKNIVQKAIDAVENPQKYKKKSSFSYYASEQLLRGITMALSGAAITALIVKMPPPQGEMGIIFELLQMAGVAIGVIMLITGIFKITLNTIFHDS